MFATFIDDAGKLMSRKHQNYFSNINLVDSINFENENDEDDDLNVYSDKIIEARFNTANVINLIELEETSTIPSDLASVTMSPRRKLSSHLSVAIPQPSNLPVPSPSKTVSAALTAQTNWKVVEVLLKEVKVIQDVHEQLSIFKSVFYFADKN